MRIHIQYPSISIAPSSSVKFPFFFLHIFLFHSLVFLLFLSSHLQSGWFLEALFIRIILGVDKFADGSFLLMQNSQISRSVQNQHIDVTGETERERKKENSKETKEKRMSLMLPRIYRFISFF